jgi:hypothetical protein
MGLEIQFFRASSSREIDAAFAAISREPPDALFVGNDGFFNSRRVQFVHQASHHRLPAIYTGREFSEIGGLMSYGTNIADAFRQAGVYAGRVLKGAKPADLPVMQSSKFELVINHQTARILGITVPQTLRRGDRMKRREFISLLGGAVAWPLAARGQQGERVRRIGMLIANAESDPEGQVRAAGFRQDLQKLGWTEGRNIRIDYRWGAAEPDLERRFPYEQSSWSNDIQEKRRRYEALERMSPADRHSEWLSA